MDKLNRYRNIVQTALSNYVKMRSGPSNHSELELQTLFDVNHDHYQLVHVGWQNDGLRESEGHRRIYGPLFHLDIKNEKVWLQLNTTDDDITQDLVRLGIPKEDIVLGFQDPYMRQFTEFAVG